MRAHYKELRLIAAVAIVAFAASWGAHLLWRGTHTEQMSDPDKWIPSYVALSAEQKRRVGEIEAKFAPQEEQLITSIRASNRALGTAIVEDGAYSPRVSAAVDGVLEAQRALQHGYLKEFFALQEPLTAAQRQTLNRKAAEALASND